MSKFLLTGQKNATVDYLTIDSLQASLPLRSDASKNIISGLVSQNEVLNLGTNLITEKITGQHISTPAENPNPGSSSLYFKADNNLYIKNAVGIEVQVATGGNSSGSSWSWNDTKDAPPNPGEIRSNNTTPSLVETIWISTLTTVGNDMRPLLQTLESGDLIYLCDANSTNCKLYNIMDGIDESSYFTLTVNLEDQSSTAAFVNGESINTVFYIKNNPFDQSLNITNEVAFKKLTVKDLAATPPSLDIKTTDAATIADARGALRFTDQNDNAAVKIEVNAGGTVIEDQRPGGLLEMITGVDGFAINASQSRTDFTTAMNCPSYQTSGQPGLLVQLVDDENYVISSDPHAPMAKTDNILIGKFVAPDLEGKENTLIGFGTGNKLVNQTYNTTVGAYALAEANTSYNTVIGAYAANITKGQRNTIIGARALQYNDTTDTNDNVVIGNSAASNVDDGTNTGNVIIGSIAEMANNVDNSIAIGYNAIVTTNCSIALGFEANVTTANTMVIGNNVTEETIQQILPGKAETCDIGAVGSEFKDAYFSGTINAGTLAGNSIQVANATNTNTLTFTGTEDRNLDLKNIYTEPCTSTLIVPPALTISSEVPNPEWYVQASSTVGSSAVSPYKAFDGIDSTLWVSDIYFTALAIESNRRYNWTTGDYNSANPNAVSTTYDGTSIYYGEWIQFRIPDSSQPIEITQYDIYGNDGTASGEKYTPSKWRLFSSSDGVTWTSEDAEISTTWGTEELFKTIVLTTPTNQARYFRIAISQIGAGSLSDFKNVANVLELSFTSLADITCVNVDGRLHVSENVEAYNGSFQSMSIAGDLAVNNIIPNTDNGAKLGSETSRFSSAYFGGEVQISNETSKTTLTHTGTEDTNLDFNLVQSKTGGAGSSIPPNFSATNNTGQTTATLTDGAGTWTAKQSSAPTGTAHYVYRAFDAGTVGKPIPVLDTFCRSAQGVYDVVSGDYTVTQTSAKTLVQGGSVYDGEWIQIQFPAPYEISGYTIGGRNDGTDQIGWTNYGAYTSPNTFKIFTSETGADNTWVEVDNRSGQTAVSWTVPDIQPFNLAAPVTATYWRLAVSKITGNTPSPRTDTGFLSVGDLRFLTTQECPAAGCIVLGTKTDILGDLTANNTKLNANLDVAGTATITGDITKNIAVAQASLTANTIATAFAAQDTYTPINSLGFDQTLANDFIITPVGGQLTYTGAITKVFSVNASWSWETTEGKNEEIVMGIHKNGTVIPTGQMQCVLDDTNSYPRNASLTHLVNLNNGDSVSLLVKNVNDTFGVIIGYMQFAVVEVGAPSVAPA